MAEYLPVSPRLTPILSGSTAVAGPARMQSMKMKDARMKGLNSFKMLLVIGLTRIDWSCSSSRRYEAAEPDMIYYQFKPIKQ